MHQILGVERGRPSTPSDQGTVDGGSVESDDPTIAATNTQSNPVLNPTVAANIARSSSTTSSEGGMELGLGPSIGPGLTSECEKVPLPAPSRSQTVTLTVPSTYVPLILPNPKSSTWCPIRANVYAEDDLILR